MARFSAKSIWIGAALCVCLQSNVAAQQFPGAIQLYYNGAPTVPVNPNTDAIAVEHLLCNQSIAGGYYCGVQGFGDLPLSAFASGTDLASVSAQTNALSAQVSGLAAQIRALDASTRSRIANASALAASLDMIRPEAGSSNRIGGVITTFDDRAAGSVTYMHQHGQLDVGAAAGFADGAAMGKLSAGFSW